METDMTGKIPRLLGAMLATTAILAIAVSSASAAKVYSNMPKPIPGNVVSLSYEATQTSEFGGQVSLAGTKRNAESVTVLMSSWGCQEGSWTNDTCKTVGGATFSIPITLNIRSVEPGGEPGPVVGSVTQTFNIPFRPSANHNCTGAQKGEWMHAGTCFNGKATKITFSLTGVTLPTDSILSVAYNTTNYGAAPVGPAPCDAFSPSRCGYDSLNVGLSETGPSTGGNPLTELDYVNSTFGELYGGHGTVGTFSLADIETESATNYQPVFEVKAGN
jgi:hypothetical protein